MKRFILLSATISSILVCSAAKFEVKAEDLSLNAKRMLSYGTTAVAVGVCKFPITPAEQKQMMASLEKYANLQKDLTEDQLTELMKAAGAQIGANKDAICAEMGKQTIAEQLADDEDGK